MTVADRERWDAKYAGRQAPALIEPPEWLVTHAAALPPGRAIDLACGYGSSAIWLAQRGWDVTAVDISSAGLDAAKESAQLAGAAVTWVCGDLDDLTLETEEFDLVTVFRFLDRTNLPSRIQQAVRPGGRLLYETFLVDELPAASRHVKNPAFLLKPEELPQLFTGFDILHYEELRRPEGSVARLFARKLESR